MTKWASSSLIATLMAIASAAHASFTPVEVPEIDAAGAVTAITLLAGVVALVIERKGRK